MAPRWLLLIHQIPPKPDYFRVKIRRRLQRLGAAPLKNAVYVLPNTEEAREDFQWLAQEIRGEGGEAIITEATIVSGVTDEEITKMLDDAGTADADVPAAAGATEAVGRGRTWVTRVGVKVDRISSAWLIRRFIDPEARFRFVAPRGYEPSEGELRFDMFEGEYTHEGDQCTFEVLCRRFGLDDRALTAIGEIVHELDVKDDRFARPETPGVRAVLDGILSSHADDTERLERGRALFENLYTTLASGAASR